MYVKPPSQGRYGIKLPENYSGSTFSQNMQYSDMPPPIRTQNLKREQFSHDERQLGDIPPDETDAYTQPSGYAEPHGYDEPHGYAEPPHYADEPKTQPDIIDKPPPSSSSIFSSLLPRGGLGNNFPFGHGIGNEELLILAIMLMVFMSGNERGETDSELLLLLGLLLFAG